VKKDSSQALEQNDWQEFKPLFGGGKIKICDTLRAVTPFGGLSVLIEFFERIGLVEQLASDHKCLRICDLCKELGIFVCTRILQRSGSGKPRPTLVWCLCAR